MTDELELSIDHISLSVEELAVSKLFYQAALAPLGLEITAEFGAEITGSVDVVGFGRGRKGNLQRTTQRSYWTQRATTSRRSPSSRDL